MKRRQYLSTALLLALIILPSFGFHNPLQAQEVRPNAGYAIANRQAMLVVQLGHALSISSVAFSPDSKFVLTGSADITARLWEVETGNEVRQFRHSNLVHSVAFSPDGRHVLTGSNDKIARLWEVDTGKEVRRFAGHSDGVISVAFSPDGRYVLTGSFDKTARLWDAATGKEVRQFAGHSGFVRSVVCSPDGKYALTGSTDNTTRLWEVETGNEVRRFVGHSSTVASVAFATNGKYVLTGSFDKTARLWEVETGKEVRQFAGHSDSVQSVASSPDGVCVLTGSFDKTARLWEAKTGKEVRRFVGHSGYVQSVALSPNGRYVLTGSNDKTARLWTVETGKEVRRFVGYSGAISQVAVSPDRKYLLTGSADSAARLWDVETGNEVRSFVGHSSGVASVAFSPDGKYVLTGSIDSTARLWEVESGNEVRKFVGHSKEVAPVAFSPDGKYVLTGSIDRTARLWEAATGKEIRKLVEHSDVSDSAVSFFGVAFSPDGKYVLAWKPLPTNPNKMDYTTQIWEIETGKEVRRFARSSRVSSPFAFSPDGRYLLAESGNNTTRLWEVETGNAVRQFIGHSILGSVAVSPDDKFVLTGNLDGTAQLWEVETGKEARQFIGHSGWVMSVAFSLDGKYVLTGSYDSTTRLWNRSNGKELCSLISFRDGNWAAVAPDGRFDVSSLEEIKGLHWVMLDEPMRTYPLELFMRDYYEPRLLPRLLSGEQFKPIQSIATLNRVQPKVAIAAVTPQKDHADLATVIVKVSKATGEFKQGDKKITRATDVYDLRLFRDGQLVAQMPEVNPATNTDKRSDVTAEQIRNVWREQARVKLEANGEQTITFKNIQLPRRADTKQVQFTAYAFNEDRVKSQTSKRTFEMPKDLTPVKGRAFVLTVGVNAYENRAWDLRFAANDARLVQQALSEGLKQSGEFAEVVNLSLISDSQPAAGARLATKASVKAAIQEIARQARPEDVVMIYYASHGYADQSGNYYFFTADTGRGKEKVITPELMRHSISSDELSAWLKDVDAGEIALIIDACQSAGTVKGEAGGEFKPGPMGSRGLGQLAYDKRMRILAASQANDSAFETASLQHGLLTYALIKDGIEARKADLNRDGQITLTEALTYTLARVPKLYETMRRGELAQEIEPSKNRPRRAINASASQKFQQPSLFDFAKSRREIVLVK